MSTAPRIAAAKRNWGADERGCTVLHIDMDAFFASLEIARHPELKGKPVIVGTGHRAVVSAASYEARTYGINSAMPAARAHQLCPNGVFLPVDGAYYHAVSQQIFHEVFSQVTDQIEQVSVDECYMDVSGALRQWEKPTVIAQWLRAQVSQRFNITCSVGIAGNKLVAKMASTNAKPDGMLLIPLDKHAEFVQMMPLRGIPGIGPALEKKLNAWGVNSVAQLAALSEEQIEQITKSASGAHGLAMAAHGQDVRRVVPYTPEKSIGAERTFDEDTRNPETVISLLRWCAARVGESLRKRGLVGRTVTVKLRFDDLHYQSRAHTLTAPVDSAAEILPVAVQLFEEMTGVRAGTVSARGQQQSSSSGSSLSSPSSGSPSSQDYDDSSRAPRSPASQLSRPVRLAGVSVSGLSDAATTAVQLTLDDILEEDTAPQHMTKSAKMREAEEALDAIRKKYGKGSAQLGV